MRDYVARAGRLAGRRWSAGPRRRGELDPALPPTPSRTSACRWPSAPRWWPPTCTTSTRRTGRRSWAASSPPSPHPPPSRGSATMRVQIDPERCQGHGRCYDLAPDLFGEDEDGYGARARRRPVPPDREDDARLAVANCPEQRDRRPRGGLRCSRPTTASPRSSSDVAPRPVAGHRATRSYRPGDGLDDRLLAPGAGVRRSTRPRSGTTCAGAARSRTPSGSAAAGCRPATRTSPRSPTTPSTSPRGRSS